MILDEHLEFADATLVGTPNNTTVNVGDVVDLTVARDIGAGQPPLYLVIQVATAVGSAGAATVSFLLASDGVAPPAVNGAQTVHLESAVFPVATLTKGYRLVLPLPAESPAYERYLGVQVRENAGFALNAGAISAFLTHDASVVKAYPDAAN